MKRSLPGQAPGVFAIALRHAELGSLRALIWLEDLPVWLAGSDLPAV
jgi:hypothetical protein